MAETPKQVKFRGVELWSINRVLRWTGFRLTVQMAPEQPTKIGVSFWGWGFRSGEDDE